MEGSDVRWKRAISGGGEGILIEEERSQQEGRDRRRGRASAAGRERLQEENSDLRRRGAIADEEERSQLECSVNRTAITCGGSDSRWR